MKHLTKKVLVACVSAGVCSAASAAGPGLGDVLKNSGIDVTGYIDVSYDHLSTDAGSFTGRNYDTERRNFSFHAIDLTVSYLPASGFGGSAELTAGKDAQVNTPVGGGSPNNFDFLQAYIQYAKGAFSVIGGKFTTLAGAEVFQAPSNTNYSRSLLFTFAEPLHHTGVRATFAPSDTLKFMVGANNGWNVMSQNSLPTFGSPSKTYGPTIELGVSANPTKMISVVGSYYSGDAPGTTDVGTRKLFDLVLTATVSDNLNFVFNYDDVSQDKGTAGGGTAKWSGYAFYANYKLNDTWRISARTEKLKDKDGFATGNASPAAPNPVQDLKETTLTLGYAPAKDMELRFEVRRDTSDKDNFLEGSLKKDQSSYAVEAVYKF